MSSPNLLSRWLREPLLHFAVIGGVLFAVDHFVAGRKGGFDVIVIDAAVDQQAQDVFKAASGRAPTEDELYGLRRVWLDNEVLYREGMALRLNEGDSMIKDRVIFKTLSMINAGLQLPRFDDETLRAWFEKNRAKYDDPARYDFMEAVLAGEVNERRASEFAAALNAGDPGDAKAGLRVFKARPRENIVQSYGEDFAGKLEALTPGKWAALPHRDGWRVMQLQAVSAAKPASYEDLRGVVLQDWKDAMMAEQRAAAVREMARKYTVRVEASPS
jgi:hypothetical protein